MMKIDVLDNPNWKLPVSEISQALYQVAARMTANADQRVLEVDNAKGRTVDEKDCIFAVTFATKDGKIPIFLCESSSLAEMVAQFAHEMGHVLANHNLREALQAGQRQTPLDR